MEKMLLCVMLAGLALPGWAEKSRAMKIEDVDPNFKVAKIGGTAINCFNIDTAPFQLSGFPWRKPSGAFYRLPEAFTEKEVNKRALLVAGHTSGG
ncbi:MAG: hypothetical protein WCV67_08925 [Victivallaceae bacterium]|jgi:hypothetical protein